LDTAEELQWLTRIFTRDKMPDFTKIFPKEISKPEYIILLTCMHMSKLGKTVYVADIVKEFSVTPQAISKQLRSCEQKGYIERNADKNNRRNVIITITSDGEKILSESHKKARLLQQKMVDKVGAEKIRALISQVDYFRSLLRETIDEISMEADEVNMTDG
jgi:DNA-binding MarR family transcriptional regulator